MIEPSKTEAATKPHAGPDPVQSSDGAASGVPTPQDIRKRAGEIGREYSASTLEMIGAMADAIRTDTLGGMTAVVAKILRNGANLLGGASELVAAVESEQEARDLCEAIKSGPLGESLAAIAQGLAQMDKDYRHLNFLKPKLGGATRA